MYVFRFFCRSGCHFLSFYCHFFVISLSLWFGTCSKMSKKLSPNLGHATNMSPYLGNAKHMQKKCTKNAKMHTKKSKQCKKWLPCWQNQVFGLSSSAPDPATRAGWENDKIMTRFWQKHDKHNDKKTTAQNRNDDKQRKTKWQKMTNINNYSTTLRVCW